MKSLGGLLKFSSEFIWLNVTMLPPFLAVVDSGDGETWSQEARFVPASERNIIGPSEKIAGTATWTCHHPRILYASTDSLPQ
jgi:hypothetical protein